MDYIAYNIRVESVDHHRYHAEEIRRLVSSEELDHDSIRLIEPTAVSTYVVFLEYPSVATTEGNQFVTAAAT